jgi:hypothetical protein
LALADEDVGEVIEDPGGVEGGGAEPDVAGDPEHAVLLDGVEAPVERRPGDGLLGVVDGAGDGDERVGVVVDEPRTTSGRAAATASIEGWATAYGSAAMP